MINLAVKYKINENVRIENPKQYALKMEKFNEIKAQKIGRNRG